jgi:hydroxymethylpyrimidine/phosphomethylpyrimidine kinase
MIENRAVLTIAGSDSGGGAGIQADLKTFSALGVFGTTVITAVTAQNLTGVYAIQPVEPAIVQKQLSAVLDGFPVKAIKTGMLFSAEIIDAVAEILGSPQYRGIPLVLDPVFISTSGKKLIRDDAIENLTKKLFPLSALVTPNIPEAETLLGLSIHNRHESEQAAHMFFKRFGVPVLLKGGHLDDHASDVLVDAEGIEIYDEELIGDIDTHGTGCTLSAAIAAESAKGEPLRKAIRIAKQYITHALKNGLELSPGIRVIDHFPCIKKITSNKEES